jgi:hypothetical protein
MPGGGQGDDLALPVGERQRLGERGERWGAGAPAGGGEVAGACGGAGLFGSVPVPGVHGGGLRGRVGGGEHVTHLLEPQ